MNTTNTKTALLTPDPPNNFEVKNIVLKISKDRDGKCEIYPLYIQGIFISKKREYVNSHYYYITYNLCQL